MTHDQSDPDVMATDSPPDQGSAGDVSTTGHSSSDVQQAGTASGDHIDPQGHDDAHGGHGGHGVDTSSVSTLVPTNWKQLILPAIILAVVAILVSGPIFGSFASRPVSTTPPGAQHNGMNGGEGGVPNTSNGAAPAGGATSEPGGSTGKGATATTAPAPPSATTASLILPTQAPTQAVQAVATTLPTSQPTDAASSAAVASGLVPTQTAVAQAGENGVVARMPVELAFAGTTFVIKAGNQYLPDWKPSADVGIATWIEGTVANHILYVPYSDQNRALFQAAKAGDKLKLTMNTGQVFEFAISRADRAVNGPAEKPGDLTVSAAMSQDHAGVTLFLIGDPAADRAVVQADFTGNIQ